MKIKIIFFLINFFFYIECIAKEKKCDFVCKSILSLSYSFALDKFINDKNQEHKFFLKDEISKYFEPFGRRSTGFYLSSSSLLLGLFTKNDYLKKMSVELFEVNILSDFAVKILQKGFGRERPLKSNGDPYKFFKNGNSFPSSHSLHSWAISNCLSQFYPNYKFIFYSIAFLSSASRVLDEKHWTSDVVFGAISGIFLSKMVHNFNKKNKKFLIFPFLEKKKYGITFLF